jgi:hypothetical protein
MKNKELDSQAVFERNDCVRESQQAGISYPANKKGIEESTDSAQYVE